MREYDTAWWKAHGDGNSDHAPMDLSEMLNKQAQYGWWLDQLVHHHGQWFLVVFAREMRHETRPTR